MEPIIKIFPSVDELADYFSSAILNRIITKKPGEYFSLAISGGSTPKAIFKIITEKYRSKIDWSRVRLFWSDERCVGPDDEESNYRMTKEYLIKNINIPELNIFRIKGENNPSEEARKYSETIKKSIPRENHIPRFDLIMLGLGEDGHTASIFPYNIGLFDSDEFFVTSAHPETGQVRITATGKLINHAREVCFLVTGSGKADIVARVVAKKEGWEQLPASKVNPANGRLVWMLDQGAGKELQGYFASPAPPEPRTQVRG